MVSSKTRARRAAAGEEVLEASGGQASKLQLGVVDA